MKVADFTRIPRLAISGLFYLNSTIAICERSEAVTEAVGRGVCKRAYSEQRGLYIYICNVFNIYIYIYPTNIINGKVWMFVHYYDVPSREKYWTD